MVEILKTVHLNKYYNSGEQVFKALDDVNISIVKGSLNIILGPSGSGKSTLLNLLGGLDFPSEGNIFIGDTDISSLNNEELTVFRRENIGFVFQEYNLVPTLNVAENIALPISLDGKELNEEIMDDTLGFLGLSGKKYDFPLHLSGGEKQRTAIARAMIANPAIILADEPTGSLDSANSHEVMNLLIDGCRKFHQTVIVVTHDEELMRSYDIDQCLRVQDGKIFKDQW